MPQKSPEWIENKVVKMREIAGMGGHSVSALVNEQLKMAGHRKLIGPTLVHKMFIGIVLVEPPEEDPEYNSFSWKRPNRLMRYDLTMFNDVQILTIEDDGTRKAWAMVINDARVETIATVMRELVPYKYDNLRTDNGCQFLETNRYMREIAKSAIAEKHINASVRHPLTLRKLSVYQKGLKRFLRYKLSNSRNKTIIRSLIDHLIKWYNLFSNNGMHHTVIDGIPEDKYSGRRDENWFIKMMRTLKSQSNIPFMVRG